MMTEDIHKWTNGRYALMFDEHTFFIFDNEKKKEMTALETTKKLNEQQTTIKNLQEEMNYWKQKYETFTFPPNCDGCSFLGNNGICGYCKFTLNCYDSKEDLVDGKVLPNCPLKPLINENEKLRKINKQLREINKEIGDDLYNCKLNKNIISKTLKLWQDKLAEYDIYTINDFTELSEARKKDKKIKDLVEELMKNDN